MQRIITLKGTVITKASNWTGGVLDGNERGKAVSVITGNGWGVFSLELSRSIIGSIGNLGYVNYDIIIQVLSSANDSPERIRQGVSQSLFQEFNGVSLYVAGDDIINNGAINPTYNANNASYQILPSLKDATGAFLSGAGISTPIAIAALLVLGVLYLKK